MVLQIIKPTRFALWPRRRRAWHTPEANGRGPGPINRPPSSASDVKSATATAESALSTFAGKARDIKTRYKTIAGDVSDFKSSIEGDDDWNKDEDKVNKEQGLLHDLDVLLADYEAAQQECANKISAIYGGPKLTSFSNDSTSAKGHYAMTADQLDALSDQGKTPWGEPTDWDKPWYRDTWDAVSSFGKGFWDGAKGMASGLVAMFNVFDWKTCSATWKGVGRLATDVVIVLALHPNPQDQVVDPDTLRKSIGSKRIAQAKSELTATGKSIIHYDEWGTDPAHAAGSSTFDIAAIVATIPFGGEGAAAKGVSAIGKAGEAMKGAGKFGRAGDVAGTALKGVEKLATTLKVENLGKIFSSKGFKFGDGLGDLTKQFDSLDGLGKTVDDLPTGHVPGEDGVPHRDGTPDGGTAPHGDGVPDDAGVPHGDGIYRTVTVPRTTRASRTGIVSRMANQRSMEMVLRMATPHPRVEPVRVRWGIRRANLAPTAKAYCAVTSRRLISTGIRPR